MIASGAIDPGSNPGGAIMKLLMKLRDEDIELGSKKQKKPKQRFAARAVLFNGDKIALLHVTKQKYHKLPRGGMKGKEKNKRRAFQGNHGRNRMQNKSDFRSRENH